MIIEEDYRDRDRTGRPARTQRITFPSQQAQVFFLRQMVTLYRSRLGIREKAVEILRNAGVPPRRKVKQALAIGQWAKDGGIYYVNEPVEIFQLPSRTIRSGLGDCDDFATCIASLVESIGIPCRLEAISVRKGPAIGDWLGRLEDALRTEDRGLSHIFPVAYPTVRGRPRRVCLDATLDFPVGTDPVKLALRRGMTVKVFAV